MWTANLLSLSSVISVTLLHYYIDEADVSVPFKGHPQAPRYCTRDGLPKFPAPFSLLRVSPTHALSPPLYPSRSYCFPAQLTPREKKANVRRERGAGSEAREGRRRGLNSR